MKEWLKHLVMRLMRPGVHALEERAASIETHAAAASDRTERLERDLASGVEGLNRRLEAVEQFAARTAQAVEAFSGATIERDKHREELGYWRWLFKTDRGRASLFAPPEEAFALWQRERLRELATTLGLAEPGAPEDAIDRALDAWCEEQSAVEIGAGPYPALAAAPRWKRAVAVDPIARAYAEEGILPPAAGHITYIEAPGERVPLPAGFADLLIIENALDHVSDPAAVLGEARRLLRPDGLLWVLVDLSNHRDHMHPHPFDEVRIRGLLSDAGFAVVSDRVSDHKSHPKAYGEYRALLRAPAGAVARGIASIEPKMGIEPAKSR